MKYVVKTRQVVERTYEYEFELELPIAETTADRIIVSAAKKGNLQLGTLIAHKDLEAGAEKVTSVVREGRQVYPRVRKAGGTVEKTPTLNTLEDE